jgi:hypothetical protein
MDLPALLSVGIGGAITWFVAWLYYRRAGSELRQEAAELRRLTTMILNALEAAGIAELSRDSVGQIVGITIRGRAAISVPQPVVRGIGHVTPPPSGPRGTT